MTSGLVVLALLLAGCINQTTLTSVPPETMVASSESPIIIDDTAWSFATTDPFPNSIIFATGGAGASSFDPNQAAMYAAGAAGNYFTPASGVQASASGATSTFAFNGCAGPFGLTALNGALMSTYSQGSSGAMVQLSSTGLTVSTFGINVAVTGTIGQSGTDRTFTYSSASTRVVDTGVTRSFSAVITWMKGSPCVQETGKGTKIVNGTTYNISLNDFHACIGQCPSAGTLTVTSPTSHSTLTYDGTSSPNAVDANGTMTAIPLSCQ